MNYFKTILTLAVAQLKSLGRNYIYVFFMVIMPVMFVLLFGMLYSNSNSFSQDAAIFNESKTEVGKQISTNLLKYLVKSDDNKKGVFNQKEAKDFADAQERMVRGEVDVIIKFPKNFGEISQTGKPKGEVEVIYRAGNSSTGQVTAGVLEKAMSEVDARMGREPAHFTVKSTESAQEGLTNFDFAISGLLGYTLMMIGLMGISNAVPEDKKTGALKRIHASPVTSAQYLLGYCLAFLVLGLIALSIQFAVAIFIFDWQMRGDWLTLIIFMFFSLVMLFGTGLAVGGWAKDEQQASGLANLVMFPLMFLSGTFVPRFLMPDFLQRLTDFVPLTPVNDGIRMIATENYGFMQILPQIGIIGLWLVVLYVLAIKVFRWE